ncbi:hypothetical protein GCM10007276_18760 [Agaricicola taiwanensis]|uniref:Uncharacterized protein n=1 Tax=Agaricicola taiwanensis TaxID=591372 RepID=A0A8J2VP79_9RHOB|nr:hypothetical protein GCM10007276_18760 [Agaricicola taiwanensis]
MTGRSKVSRANVSATDSNTGLTEASVVLIAMTATGENATGMRAVAIAETSGSVWSNGGMRSARIAVNGPVSTDGR